MTLYQHFSNADAIPQFIVSKITTDYTGVRKKVPCDPLDPMGPPSSHKDPKNWVTLTQATEAVQLLGPSYFVGLSVTREIKRFFLDLDKQCVNGQWSDLAKDICAKFPGCYIEVSQSGTGLHIIGSYTGELIHKNKNTLHNIELYTHDRFVLLTGNHPVGDWAVDGTAAIEEIIQTYFRKDGIDSVIVTGDEDEIGEPETLTDDQVIERCKSVVRPESVFGGGISFNQLYDGDMDAISREYPPRTQGKEYDASAADLALANMIGTQSGNLQQTIRILRGSRLHRDKWDSHKTYLLDTAQKAVANRRVTPYQPAKTNTGDNTNQVLSDMPQEFEGCFFVVTDREVYSTEYGMLNQDAFNMVFGGMFQKDPPYKTFKTHAKASGRIVSHLGFRPDLPHGAISEREGLTSVNSYKPIVIRRQTGDTEPFFRFLNAMIPNKRDQRILLSYAAVMVQKPGVKSQWCPVLQGVQGCGKSLFADFVAFACGETYTHRAKGDEFENRFNSQWFAKTLILIEDPRLKESKLEEVLKPLITSKSLSFEGKGKKIQMNDFPANFIITLNDFDLLQKRADSRRFSVFMSALQTPDDLINAGMVNAEYSRIVNWRDQKGYEIIADYLHSYTPDPEFDFSGTCVTAPNTSTTADAIEESRTDIELMILDEVAQGRIGFRGGWISSVQLSDMLEQKRLRHLMPDRKRGKVLQSLGYVYHPLLSEGRAVRPVQPDNRRPRLFIKKGHPALKMNDRELVTQAYEEAQKAT